MHTALVALGKREPKSTANQHIHRNCGRWRVAVHLGQLSCATVSEAVQVCGPLRCLSRVSLHVMGLSIVHDGKIEVVMFAKCVKPLP